MVRALKAEGVTIVLTTHYIEEAEAMADRVGVINKGRLLLVEEKTALMQRMGKRQLRIELQDPVAALPEALAGHGLDRAEEGRVLVYSYDSAAERTGITRLLTDLAAEGLVLSDLQTRQSTLEEIFVDLVRDGEDAA